MINILTAPRVWLRELNKRRRAVPELRARMLAVRSQHSACATLCRQCSDGLIAPEWSAYVPGGREIEDGVRHLWRCTNCDYRFETFLNFTASTEFLTESPRGNFQVIASSRTGGLPARSNQQTSRCNTGDVMNSSLWSADRMTHVKIVAVSLIMAIVVVVAVGSSVRVADTNNYADRIVIKAGQPVGVSTIDVSTIR